MSYTRYVLRSLLFSAQSPVHDAAGRGDVDALRILLIDSTLLNAKDEFGYTPLHVATDRGRKEAVQYLVSQGADKTIRVSGSLRSLQCPC